MRDCYRVKYGQLPNGLRFYTQYDSSSTKEIAVIAIKAGSFHDLPNQRGLAHITEHVVCGQSETYDRESAWRLKSKITGDSDEDILITTDRTATTYGPADCRKKTDNRKLFQMYAEMVSKPIIKKNVLMSEKAAVHQEHFLRGRDCAGVYIFDLLNQLVFPKTFLCSSPIDGSMWQVHRITVGSIKKFVNKYYVPRNAFVVYLGPKFYEAELVIADNLGNWGADWNRKKNKEAKFSSKKGLGGFKILTSHNRKTIKWPGIHQHHIAIGFPTETYLTNDAEALDILARVLSDRMYTELRDKNFNWREGAYRTPVCTERTFMHGLLAFNFATLDEGFSKYGELVFKEQCQRLCSELISKDELETWVGYEYEYCFQDMIQNGSGWLVDYIITAVSNGDLDLTKLHTRGERLLRLLKRGGRQYLREVARKYLSGHSATVIIKPV